MHEVDHHQHRSDHADLKAIAAPESLGGASERMPTPWRAKKPQVGAAMDAYRSLVARAVFGSSLFHVVSDAVVVAGDAPDGNPLHEAPATRDVETDIPGRDVFTVADRLGRLTVPPESLGMTRKAPPPEGSSSEVRAVARSSRGGSSSETPAAARPSSPGASSPGKSRPFRARQL